MVDLVLSTSTEGQYGPIEPPTPEREAFLSDSVFRHFHRLNSVTTVTKGSYVQFDAPDKRRFYQPYPNLEAYPPRGVDFYRDPKYWRLILVDEHQRIVDILSSSDEGWTMQLIETLLARTAGAAHQ